MNVLLACELGHSFEDQFHNWDICLDESVT